MSFSSVQGSLSYSSTNSAGIAKKSSPSGKSIKRTVNDCKEGFVPLLEKKVEQVSAKSIKRTRPTWTCEQEEILKMAVEKASRHSGKVSFSKLAEEDPDVKNLGKNGKQLGEKWINNLCPDSLGGSIMESHKPTIKQLHKEHGRKWAKISRIFAKTVLEGKPIGKYYSGNTIKNYFNRGCRKKNRGLAEDEQSLENESCQEKELRDRSSSATTIESQDRVRSFDEWVADKNQSEVFAKNSLEGDFSDDEMLLSVTDLDSLKSFA